MCYICSFFAWTLDLIQRIITFALACLIAFAVCFGFSIAIIAGIAYGYNYSLAEFLTFARSDVTVYLRRGQFYNNPDTIYPRRSGKRHGEEDEVYHIKTSSNHQRNTAQNNIDPLSSRWMEPEDTRSYAEILTKYSNRNTTTYSNMKLLNEFNYFKVTMPPSRRVISITPLAVLSTTILQIGSSEIVMRNFLPIDQLPILEKFNRNKNFDTIKTTDKQREDSVDADIKIRLVERSNEVGSFMPTGTTYTAHRVLDYPTENIDEYNTLYKPV